MSLRIAFKPLNEARLPAMLMLSDMRPTNSNSCGETTSTTSFMGMGPGRCAASTRQVSPSRRRVKPSQVRHRAPSTVRRVATVPASEKPKISNRGAPKRCSASRAISAESGAVAEIAMRSSGKRARDDRSARR